MLTQEHTIRYSWVDDILSTYIPTIKADREAYLDLYLKLTQHHKPLKDVATNYCYYGIHHEDNNWVFREWAPHATKIYLVGDFSNWHPLERFRFKNQEGGNWELSVPYSLLKEGVLYRLFVEWQDGCGWRIPTYSIRQVQDNYTKHFNAVLCETIQPYLWKNARPNSKEPLCIYELHVGMSSEYKRVTSFKEFQYLVLPRIKAAGYNTVQLIGLQEHPYYGSFGYHVSNFYGVSSRFGTPLELKEMIDAIHGDGIKVIMDLVHSHSVKNTDEGLSNFAGDFGQFFVKGAKGYHPIWDSYCFDYSKKEVLEYLLSNCRYWLEEYQLDGFRFDGVTSILYNDHGIGRKFLSYSDYYGANQNRDGLLYLMLANRVIHSCYREAITIAEDVSGYPGLTVKLGDGGVGFDYRLQMSVPDYWSQLVRYKRDEDWQMGDIVYQLTNRRKEEHTVIYTESHDQALVGSQTLFFSMAGADMYNKMDRNVTSLVVDRAMALDKVIRLLTLGMAQDAYMNFIGNEWGHPEWIDFPREGNRDSYDYARRQWSLADNKSLKYSCLQCYDVKLMDLFRKTQFSKDSINYVNFSNEAHVISFMRGDYLFVFNLSPNESYNDYKIPVKAGKYQIYLDTDELAYGGYGRQDMLMQHFSFPKGSDALLSLYLTTRTGMVLKRI